MNPRFHFGACTLDVATRELRRDGAPVVLQARVFECLLYLIEHRDRAVTRDELVRAVFGRSDVSDAQLGQVIVRTRRAVGDDGQAQHTILTVPRYGFRWVAAVRIDAAAPPAGETPDTQDTRPSASAPACAPAPARRPLAPWASLVLVLAVIPGTAWWLARGPAAPPTGVDAGAGVVDTTAPATRALLVLPTRVDAAGEELAWVRLGLMDYIGDRLRRGGLAVLSSESALAAHARGGLDDPGRLRATLGDGWRVESEVARRGTGWSVRLAARGADGVAQASAAEAGELLDAARLAVDRLAPRLGGTAAGAPEEADLGERLQRARAAMLANELDAARGILMGAPELQRAQPRLQYQLARVDFRAGEHARGLQRLDRLLDGDGAGEPLFRAQVLNARGAMLVRLERLEEALATYDAAVAQAGPHPAELGQALSGRAVVHAMEARFDRALSDFAEARVALRRAGDALAVARIDANLGILEVDRGRPAQALPLLAGAEAAFAGMGAINELGTAIAARAKAELQLLRVRDALDSSARGMDLLDRIADPAQAAELVRARASALRLAGQASAASALLAERTEPAPGLSARMEAALLDASLALDRGAPERALAVARSTLAEVPAGVQPELRAWLALRRDQAAWRLEQPVPPGPEAGFGAFVPDRLRHALALWRSGAGPNEVEAAFGAALSLAERQGVPAAIAEVVQAQAEWLLGEGREAEVAPLLGRAAPWADEVPALARLQARLEGALENQD